MTEHAMRRPKSQHEADAITVEETEHLRIPRLEDTRAEYADAAGAPRKCGEHPEPSAEALRANDPIVNEVERITIHLMGNRAASKNGTAIKRHDPLPVTSRLDAPFAFGDISATRSPGCDTLKPHHVIMTAYARQLYDEKDMEAILAKTFGTAEFLSPRDDTSARDTAIALYRTAEEWRREMIETHTAPVLSHYGPGDNATMTVTMHGNREDGWTTTVTVEPPDRGRSTAETNP